MEQLVLPRAARRRPSRKASQLLVDSVRHLDGPDVSIRELLGLMGERAFGLILVLFALPNCIPGPPGLGSVFGLPLILFGVQLAQGRPAVWLPDFIARRRIGRDTLTQLVFRAVPLLQRIERVCRPRWPALTAPLAERLLGGAITMLAVGIMMPLPLTNFVPAIGVAVIALGLLEEDGVTVVIGLAIGAVGLSLVGIVLATLAALSIIAFG
jgi:hypothetical protein